MLLGIVDQVLPPTTLILPETFTRPDLVGRTVVEFSPSAEFWRGRFGRVAELDAFIPNDQIVAEGEWIVDAFAARKLLTYCHLIEGSVVQRAGDRIQTTSGTIQLVSDTFPIKGPGFVSKPLAEIGAGDPLWVEAWDDPVTQDLVALRIGVRG